jgi:hypothetical protein
MSNQPRNARMTVPNEPTRQAFEHPDEGGYPEEGGTLSDDRTVLIEDGAASVSALLS